MHCSPPGSSVPRTLQVRILEWGFPTPGDPPDPGIAPKYGASPALAGGFFATAPPGKLPSAQGPALGLLGDAEVVGLELPPATPSGCLPPLWAPPPPAGDGV